MTKLTFNHHIIVLNKSPADLEFGVNDAFLVCAHICHHILMNNPIYI